MNSRMLAHRRRDAVAALELLETREGERHSLQGERKGDDAASVDCRRDVVRRAHRRPPRGRRASPACTRMRARAGSPRCGQPCARQRASMPACLPEQLWLSGDGGSPSAPHSSSSTFAGPSRAARGRPSSWSSSARCEAEAIARSRVARSSRARASGTACSGFEEERMKSVSEDRRPRRPPRRPVPRRHGRGGPPRRRRRGGRLP